MANLSKLSSLGGLVVAGAALGLYLGSSAISEINPAYYSTPFASSKFHADLVPNPGDRDSAQPLPELAQVATDLGSTCVTCRLAPDEYAAVDYPSPERYGSYGAVPADLVVAQAEESVSGGLSLREVRDIERYAHFRVSEDDEGPALAVATADRRGRDLAPAAEPEGEAAPGT